MSSSPEPGYTVREGWNHSSTRCVRAGFLEADAEVGILVLMTSWGSALGVGGGGSPVRDEERSSGKGTQPGKDLVLAEEPGLSLST